MSSYNKTKLQVWIPNTLNEKFRELIHQKYQKYEKGLLSYEVEMALRHWLALHTNTQNTFSLSGKPNPPPRVMHVFNQVKDWLLSHYYYELQTGQQISIDHLKKAIMVVRGSDPRTIEKWLKVFVKMKLVKPITGASWEIL